MCVTYRGGGGGGQHENVRDGRISRSRQLTPTARLSLLGLGRISQHDYRRMSLHGDETRTAHAHNVITAATLRAGVAEALADALQVLATEQSRPREQLAVTKSPELADDQSPGRRRRADHAQQEVPQLLQSDAPRGRLASAVAVGHLDVDDARLEQLAAVVGAGGEQEALVVRQAVATEEHARRVAVRLASRERQRRRASGRDDKGRAVQTQARRL